MKVESEECTTGLHSIPDGASATISRDYYGTITPTDELCAARCNMQPWCIAWTRNNEYGQCYTYSSRFTNKGVVFQPSATWNSGLRCKQFTLADTKQVCAGGHTKLYRLYNAHASLLYSKPDPASCFYLLMRFRGKCSTKWFAVGTDRRCYCMPAAEQCTKKKAQPGLLGLYEAKVPKVRTSYECTTKTGQSLPSNSLAACATGCKAKNFPYATRDGGDCQCASNCHDSSNLVFRGQPTNLGQNPASKSYMTQSTKYASAIPKAGRCLLYSGCPGKRPYGAPIVSPQYVGCYANNKLTIHVGYVTVDMCQILAASAAMSYFGMENPDGATLTGQGKCMLLASKPELPQTSDRECERKTDEQLRRLGGKARLALYSSQTSSGYGFNFKSATTYQMPEKGSVFNIVQMRAGKEIWRGPITIYRTPQGGRAQRAVSPRADQFWEGDQILHERDGLEGLVKLETLYLNDNTQLKQLGSHAFDGFGKGSLRQLHLNNGNIRTVGFGAFSGLTRANVLEVNSNVLKCDIASSRNGEGVVQHRSIIPESQCTSCTAGSYALPFILKPFGYQGCFVNAGRDRIGGHSKPTSLRKCKKRATKAGALFFGLENPKGTQNADDASCLLLNDMPAQDKAADKECEAEKDFETNRLGGVQRLAVYPSGGDVPTGDGGLLPAPEGVGCFDNEAIRKYFYSPLKLNRSWDMSSQLPAKRPVAIPSTEQVGQIVPFYKGQYNQLPSKEVTPGRETIAAAVNLASFLSVPLRDEPSLQYTVDWTPPNPCKEAKDELSAIKTKYAPLLGALVKEKQSCNETVGQLGLNATRQIKGCEARVVAKGLPIQDRYTNLTQQGTFALTKCRKEKGDCTDPGSLQVSCEVGTVFFTAQCTGRYDIRLRVEDSRFPSENVYKLSKTLGLDEVIVKEWQINVLPAPILQIFSSTANLCQGEIDAATNVETIFAPQFTALDVTANACAAPKKFDENAACSATQVLGINKDLCACLGRVAVSQTVLTANYEAARAAATMAVTECETSTASCIDPVAQVFIVGRSYMYVQCAHVRNSVFPHDYTSSDATCMPCAHYPSWHEHVMIMHIHGVLCHLTGFARPQ